MATTATALSGGGKSASPMKGGNQQ